LAQLCHAIDMCYWLLDDPNLEGFGQAGPDHPTLGCPMDITCGLRSPKTGVICSLAASFNNHGPIISEYRFIAEETTIIKGADGQFLDHEGAVVELSEAHAQDDGIAAGDDAEFLAAIREGRPGLCDVSACLPVMRLIDQVQKSIDSRRPLQSRL
jgi:2-hydroxy-4-carboxymuconate semialdehyde hemiacetal dehydrogenase